MANGYFERGEIYWIRMDNGFGGEQGVGRPGLVLSENSVNTKCSTVTIAFMSTKHHPSNPFYLPVEATGITSYVVLNQIMTYDKVRIGKYMGMLNSAEQKTIDDALENLFDLGYVDEVALKAKDAEIADRDVLIGDLRTEMAGAVAEIAKRNEEIASLKMEIEMWQKCYGRCMDMLVDTKVNSDLSRRVVPAEPKIVEPKMVEPKVGTAAAMIPDLTPDLPKQPEEPVLEKKVELNGCTETDLRKCGCTEAQARCIKNYCPYTKVEDLLCTPGVTRALFDILKDKVYCEPPIQDDRLDINSCTATALKKIGFSLAMARKIVESRPFSSVEDLKRVNGLKTSQFRIMAPKLCCVPVKEVEQPEVTVVEPVVEPVVEQERDPGFEKVNINTAKAVELRDICGFPATAAYSITGYRKKNGPFQCVDDLLKVSNVSKKAVARCRDMLEV